VAALQLVEQGKIVLDDLVEKFVPEISKIPILTGFDAGIIFSFLLY
jgi:CubicO group peptidase (beta-lactamase class C family)